MEVSQAPEYAATGFVTSDAIFQPIIVASFACFSLNAGGVDFWAEQLDAVGGNLNAIIDAFGNSQEYNDRIS